MAVTVTHATVATGADDPTKEINKGEWNAGHTVAGLGTLATQDGTFSGTSSGTNTGDQTIVLSGDISGTGTGSITTLLPNIVAGATATKITFNAKGQVTASASATLASADFVNQGTTTTVLHGNAAGNPAFSAVIEADITLADNATNNVSTARHGFAPKAPNDVTKFLDGTGAYSAPTTGTVSDGDKGDISVSGSGTVWTIDNDVVSYAKMQNVSAASKLIGRGSAGGSGDPEEITIGSNLTMTGTTLSATAGSSGPSLGLVCALFLPMTL